MKSLGNFWICIITKYLKFSFTRVKKKTELTRILLIVKEEKRTLGNTKTGIIITSGLKKKVQCNLQIPMLFWLTISSLTAG